MTENEIAKIIVDAAIEVHRELGGPGLLEDVYEEALAEELRLRGLNVERQLPLRINYKGRILSKPLRLGMKVAGLVLVDNKAVTEWNPIFEAQMLTYLRLTGLKLGLVINFGEQFVKNGVHRVVNGLPEDTDFSAKAQRRGGEMKKNFSNGLIALLAFVALLLVILLGWQSRNHARLKIEVALAEEQTRIFEQMGQQANQGSPSGAAESLAYVVNYYPSGTKQRAGSRLDKVVERKRSSAVRNIISQLRQKTGEDLGEKPETWIEKYAKNK